MKNSLKIFTVRGISIYLHWTFGLLIVLMLFVQSATGTAVTEAIWSVAAIVAVFACVVLHELGHAFAARRYGIRTKTIMLLPIGGISTMEKMPEKPIPEIIVSAAGPLVNLLIAAILLPFIYGYPPFWKAAEVPGYVNQDNFIYYLYVINIMLALFNLIPAFPMDGGRILKGILGLFTDTTRATAIAAFTGRIIAAMFIVSGLVVFDIFLMLIGLFIIVSGAGEEKLIYLKAAARGTYLKDLAPNEYHSFPPDMMISEAAEKMLQCQDKYFLVMDRTAVAGIIDRNTILRALSNGKHQESVRKFMTADIRKLDGESPVPEVIDILAVSKVPALPVVSGGQVTGTINMQHIIEYLMVHDFKPGEQHPGRAMNKFLEAG